MTRQTRLLAFVIATSGIVACYTAPALTYDPTGAAAPEKDSGALTKEDDKTPPPAPTAEDASIADAAEGGAPKSDGGTDAGGDAGRDAGPVTVTCSSATYWDTSAPSSEYMHPGKTCIACHSAQGGPAYVIAGTVYPTMHEPDDCNGVDGTATSMTILIIDAAGVTHTIPVDESGNFKRVTSVPLPYRATVISGGNVREMRTPQFDGDCNGCHSTLGNKSPGRVMAP
jgi:hypothetical protein